MFGLGVQELLLILVILVFILDRKSTRLNSSHQ